MTSPVSSSPRRGAPAPAVVPAILLSALLFGFAGCSDDSSAPTGTEPVASDVQRLFLEDDFGVLAVAATDSAGGEIVALRGESVRLRIRAAGDEGAFDPFDANPSLALEVDVRDGAVAEAGVVVTPTSTCLRVLGVDAGTTALRLRLVRSDRTAFVSAWIPVRVAEPIDSVAGLVLWPSSEDALYHEYRGWSSGPLFIRNQEERAITVTFTSLDGLQIDPASLGRTARLEVSPSPVGLLTALPRAAEQFGFDLHAGDIGSGRLQFRLTRGDRVLYASPGAVVQIVAPPAADWAPLDTTNAPDGPVYDLLLHDGRLVLGGGFGHVGTTAARGVAAWDGTSWSAFGDGLDGVIRLHADGAILVAETITSGFHRWTGSAWEPIAPAHGTAQAAAFFEGGIVVTGHGLGVLAWRDGGWTQIGDPAWNGEDLTVHAGSLCCGGSSRDPGGPVPYWSSHVWRRVGGSWTSIFSRGHEPGSCVMGLLESRGEDLLVSLSCGSPGGDGGEIDRLSQAAPEPIADRAVSSSARLGDRSVFADRATVYLLEPAGLRAIGKVEGTERIHDLEAFGGALIAAGDFTAIDGRSADYLASWRP